MSFILITIVNTVIIAITNVGCWYASPITALKCPVWASWVRRLSLINNASLLVLWKWSNMMTSSNGNIFRSTGPLCEEFTGHRWIPLTKASDAEFDVFFDLHLNKQLSKQLWGWWFEMPSCSLWRHFNKLICHWLSAKLWYLQYWRYHSLAVLLI